MRISNIKEYDLVPSDNPEVSLKGYQLITDSKNQRVVMAIVQRLPNPQTGQKGIISHLIEIGWQEELKGLIHEMGKTLEYTEHREE